MNSLFNSIRGLVFDVAMPDDIFTDKSSSISWGLIVTIIFAVVVVAVIIGVAIVENKRKKAAASEEPAPSVEPAIAMAPAATPDVEATEAPAEEKTEDSQE